MFGRASTEIRALLNRKVLYPKGFLWGSATSSHQVEGGSTGNNWIAFEDAKDANGRPASPEDNVREEPASTGSATGTISAS